MGRKRYDTPSRDEFEAIWMDFSVTVKAMAAKFGVSEPLISKWAARWKLPQRDSKWRRQRGNATPPKLPPHENHCRPINDGPLPGDPTPVDIAARAAEIKAEHIRQKRSGLIA